MCFFIITNTKLFLDVCFWTACPRLGCITRNHSFNSKAGFRTLLMSMLFFMNFTLVAQYWLVPGTYSIVIIHSRIASVPFTQNISVYNYNICKAYHINMCLMRHIVLFHYKCVYHALKHVLVICLSI